MTEKSKRIERNNRILRDEQIEQATLEFYRALPRQLLQFPFDIKKALAALPRCKVYSYQEFAVIHGISVQDVIAYCESYAGCTEKQKGNYMVLYNDSDGVVEGHRRFTLGHEGGHIRLGHCELPKETRESDAKALDAGADYFSACVLCPIPILSRLHPQSTLSIRKVFSLSNEASEIAYDGYKSYDRHYNEEWHREVQKIFAPQIELLQMYTQGCDHMHYQEELRLAKVKSMAVKPQSLVLPRSWRDFRKR